MNYTLSFIPEVEEDAVNGYRWYEEKAIGLGEEFLRIFYTVAGEISRNPLIYQTAYKDFRRCLLKRFPYAIYYKTGGQTVIVSALFHCARNPNVLQKNLRNREQKLKKI